jgi:predicted metalloprotease with PDZ domain
MDQAQSLPEQMMIPVAQDVAPPSRIELQVDATDVQRGIFRVRERMRVAPGKLTLLYPKWLPGYHAPQAPIELFAGLELSTRGRPLAWKRDLIEVYAFHVDVPDDASELELSYQFLSPTTERHGRILVTPEILTLPWNAVILYPAGYHARRIEVAPSVAMPPGFRHGCALQVERTERDVIYFEPVSLDVLVDSPLYAGRHHRSVVLDETKPVRLQLFAEREDQLEATPEQVELHRALVKEADALFGARPFSSYDFLVSLSEELGSVGVEHHASAEIGTTPAYFSAWNEHAAARDVMAHEYVHAWNGKYRRGVDSATASFEQPIGNSLMWVYEGQTQYWGNVLSTRSGLWSLEDALGALARTAAIYAQRPGRRWRPVSDTVRDPIIASRGPLPWVSWQRSEDYYSEGQLIWLEVDTLIRERTSDTRSLDDFARTFFSAEGRVGRLSTYDLHEVLRKLEALVPFEWEPYFRERLETRDAPAPLEGLTRGGYQLVFERSPCEFAKRADAALELSSFRFSLGLTVGTSGLVQDVVWESPAFEAGLTAGTQLLAVNGRSYSAEELEQALQRAESGASIELWVKRAARHRTVAIEYRGGPRHPRLVPIAGARRRLDEIFRARAT